VFIRDGYDVDIADSAESAFKLLEHRSYDLIITDIILPGISGIELLTKYRKKNPTQKVIIITAYASLTTAVEAIKAGASDFIIKPLMHDEMKRAVRKALDGPDR
jgi:DNA-binding NtrC family response regulator